MKVTGVGHAQNVSQPGEESYHRLREVKGNKVKHEEPGNIIRNEKVVTEEQVIEAIEKANKSLALPKTRFEFTIHDETKEIMVKVINEDTGEIIREIPPEKILDLVAKIWELAGLLVDERV